MLLQPLPKAGCMSMKVVVQIAKTLSSTDVSRPTLVGPITGACVSGQRQALRGQLERHFRSQHDPPIARFHASA